MRRRRRRSLRGDEGEVKTAQDRVKLPGRRSLARFLYLHAVWGQNEALPVKLLYAKIGAK